MKAEADHGTTASTSSHSPRQPCDEFWSNHARRLHAVKRGKGARRVDLDDVESLAVEERAGILIALDEALDRLADLEPRQAYVVECRWFAGLTEEETAKALGIGLRTAKRDWAMARSWLYQELLPGGGA